MVSAVAKMVVILVKVIDGDRLHDVGALDFAEVSVRPAHGPGLEIDDTAGACQPGRDGRDHPDDTLLNVKTANDSCGCNSYLPGAVDVRADDPKLKRLEPPRLKPWEKFFLPQIAVGLGVTAQHIAGVMFANKAITFSTPRNSTFPAPIIAACTVSTRTSKGG